MIIKTVAVTNFGSYPRFAFDFDQVGPCLIYGETGSGKSTFMDAVSWCLLGVTAKDGNVDEIRSWQTPDEPTTGEITVEAGSATIQITRVRGKAGQNDLYWTEFPENKVCRGKDLAETQKLLEARLGISAAAFLSSSYLHEFSPTGTFWVASAKDRRKLFERVAPLEFPTLLASRASDARKEAKAALGRVEVVLAGFEGQLKQSEAMWEDTAGRANTYEFQRKQKAEELALKAVRFETDRQIELAKLESVAAQWQAAKTKEFKSLADELETLKKKIRKPEEFDTQIRALMDQARCPSCKSLPLAANSGIAKLQSEKTANAYNVNYFEQGRKRLVVLDKELSNNPYLDQIANVKKNTNTFKAEGAKVLAEVNPYIGQVEKLALTINTQKAQVKDARQALTTLQERVADLTREYELSFELRGQLLQRAVQAIQDHTNAVLEKYFDAEIRVSFSLPEADTLEVEIQKSGYDCTYRQLSKGQRGLLKLAFGVSVMTAVANQIGSAPSTLFFDEALDGLSETLKLKAYGLFEELATHHPQVFIIDHSPGLQGLVDQKYLVVLRGDASEMTRET